MNWRDQLLSQLEFYWDTSLWPRIQGLTDEEYFWEPVENTWSIREQPDGSFMADWQFPEPVPPPVTTIAWRLAHIAIGCFGLRASAHFGDGSLTLESAPWPGNAETALALLQDTYEAWHDGVKTVDLEAPVGKAEGPWAEHPYAALVLHITREVCHHGGEIGVLRDLYRARF
ncbi:DinB family protein [Kibdelosporangium aridum]|uniref:DinB family protein n=1 Tax=Kibdelosporangium aridum TaxID=2030 RepID=A0A428YNC2_KIBAR|nr:DinB family protein [Kibdelosporangium aridum]RSM69846.1 DinB family protein [Kibdelosporangium aridum]